MGTPWIGFMRDEFKWNQKKGAWSFGLITLAMGLPTVFFFQQGVFDEYDYWAGTVSLVVFALAEVILFSWIFGMDKGWKEINRGGDIKVPNIYRFIIKWVTPLMLLFVFIGSLVTPLNNEWINAIQNGWELDNSSIIKQLSQSGLKEQIAATTDPLQIAELEERHGYITFARLMLVGLFAFISILVYVAYQKRIKEGRIK
jgi:neurotransmitter:Na+ symporter, NSS family